MFNMLIVTISLLVFIIGLLVPGGSILMAGSTAMLIYKSERVRRFIKYFRIKYTWWNNMLLWFEEKFGQHNDFVRKALNDTRPDN